MFVQTYNKHNFDNLDAATAYVTSYVKANSDFEVTIDFPKLAIW